MSVCIECGHEKPCECLDFTTKGFCGDCGQPLLIGDFDWGECPKCGSKNLKDDLT